MPGRMPSDIGYLYDWAMATDKLSATVDASLLAEVRRRVGPRGLSAFVGRALQHELDRVALRDLLDDLSATLGPPDEVMVGEADAALEQISNTSSRRRRRAPAA